jgi:hypothetical protein
LNVQLYVVTYMCSVNKIACTHIIYWIWNFQNLISLPIKACINWTCISLVTNKLGQFKYIFLFLTLCVLLLVNVLWLSYVNSSISIISFLLIIYRHCLCILGIEFFWNLCVTNMFSWSVIILFIFFNCPMIYKNSHA